MAAAPPFAESAGSADARRHARHRRLAWLLLLVLAAAAPACRRAPGPEAQAGGAPAGGGPAAAPQAAGAPAATPQTAGSPAAASPTAGPSNASPARPPRNVIFILVDTLRADHLPLYGYRRDTSPHLSALGRESVVFDSVRSQASCTFPSVNSLLTSRWPAAFLGQPGGAIGLPAGVPGLAEILQARGFHTAAVSASPIVRKSPGRFNPLGGFGRGFDSFQEDCVWRGADCVTGQALPHLGGDARPLFLYLHYLDPHGPYAPDPPPPSYRPRFALAHPAKDFIRRGDPGPIARWIYDRAPDPGLGPGDLAFLVDLYDDKIAFFDAQLGRLLDRLRSTGLLDDSVLVLAADHGEEFLEHGDIKHCRNLFDTTIRTPLLLRIPGVAPRRIAAPVSNLDIVPTLLDLLGAPPALSAASPAGAPGGPGAPPTPARSATPGAPGSRAAAAFAGRSLLPLLAGRPLAGFQWSAQGALRSVADGRWKLVEDLGRRRLALYDLAADPGETRDVADAHRAEVRRLQAALAGWLARTEGLPAGERARRADEAARRLHAVGYLD